MHEDIVLTPMMKQFLELKAKHPDAVMLFRCGDFYETYSTDAVLASEILGITLTKRANGKGKTIEMAGFPHHALDTYLPKLIRAGKRVAICDQLEDPKLTKKLVKRGITELVTPGVSINDNILNYRENNFLAAVHFGKGACGVAFLDISTGEFLTAEGSFDHIDKLLNNFAPKEVLFERGRRGMFEGNFGSKFFTFELDDWVFTETTAREKLLKHFEVKNLKGFGVEHLKNGIIASGAILQYLIMTQHTQIGHITSLARIEEDKYVRLDKFTVRSLELMGSMNDGGSSLLDVIDKTISPMGARLLKRWMVFPLKDVKPINGRLDVVEYFFRKPEFKGVIEEQLHLIGDLERIISKVAVGRVSPREVVALKVALQAIEPIKEACMDADNASLNHIGGQLDICRSIRDRIEREINNDPPLLVNKGGVIKSGVNAELDELRRIAYSGKDYLLQIQQRESELTGIPSLKIGYNNVFGYYIEVRNVHKDKVPQEWIRKQTLVNAERYITQELKEYEEKILGAEDKILVLETQLYAELVQSLSEFIPAIQTDANQIARLDCLLSFATAARENNYIRPVISDDEVLEIHQGRHPVIEKQLPIGEKYVANDVMLDSSTQQIIIITGPNMAGKSALLRQTALITLMAQIGCFVPAESAHIGLVDKIFTRVGASDNISVGESTFMVEMNEAADILNNLSSRSLVLFDELGRGTSTYDGISIAWAIVEYIHEHPHAKARTLFATHYHELNEMEKSFKRIKNYNVSVKEIDNKVIFLRKLERGGSEHSFGIHVAKMAGMPKSIVKRAGDILKQLEKDNRQQGIAAKPMVEVELKEYEEKILGAEDKILVLETQLYAELVQSLSEFIPAIQTDANQIARLDCLLSFATAARENNYIRPVISDDEVLEIHQGRHPVIEKQLPIGEKYVANDVMLDSSTQQIIIITGPNMAGKSALLRQTALITLMAQIGCFVPAESAHIGLVDKIFTRVGASDNISVGESTFMVEMNEAADILNNLSSRSLVLFDELGRGTSTYDGISIAWAIVEYIHEHPHAKARTLFATHYHELNEMEKSFKRIKNYNVSVKEIDNKVIFLRKLERGGSEHSFGIHVAKMAGMPKSIVKRAGDILKQLEKDNRQQGIAAKPMVEVGETRGGMQLSFFQLDDPVLCQIRDEILNLDVNNLTPLEALNKLNDIKRIVKGK